MTLPTPDEVAATLTDSRLRDIRKAAERASAGRWGAWGMSLCVAADGDLNVEKAEWVATFHTTDESGRPRAFDVNHAVNMQPMTAIALIDEVLRLRRMQPPGTIPLAGLPDEDPRIEAQWQANRTGKTVAFRDATGWVEVEPEQITVDGDTITVPQWLVRSIQRGLRRSGSSGVR